MFHEVADETARRARGTSGLCRRTCVRPQVSAKASRYWYFARRLLLAGQLELVSDVSLLPIDVPLGQDAVQFGAPIAAGLRLVVEKADDRLAEIGPKMIVVRLVDRFQEPIDAILAGAVDAQLSVLGPVDGPGRG